jgi:hypothetical protein
MSNARKLALAAVSMVVLFLCRPAAAQQLVIPDDVAQCAWLKITARGTGYEYMADAAGLGAKRSIRADCYLQLVYTGPTGDFPHGSYAGPLLCQVDAANWEASVMEESFVGMKLADLNVLGADVKLTFKNAGGDVIQGFGTHRILIKVDPKTGAFKSAIFQTLGGEMIGSSMFFESFMTVVGGYTAKGTTVPVAKVPPGALALVAGSPCN